MKLKNTLSALFIAVCLCAPLRAQEGPAFYSVGPLNGWNANPCGKTGFALLQPFAIVTTKQGRFGNNGDKYSDGEYKQQINLNLFATYGITERVDVSAQLYGQYNYRRPAPADRANGNSAETLGISDTSLYLKALMFNESGNRPGISLFSQFKLPTGKYQNGDPAKLGTDLLGRGSFDMGYGFILTKTVANINLHADAYYSFPFHTTVDNVRTAYGNYLNYDFVAEYGFTKALSGMLEINGFTQGQTKLDGVSAADTDSRWLTVMPALSLGNDKIQAVLGYQYMISGKNTDALDSVICSVALVF